MSLSYKEVAEILKIIDASSCEEVVLELENTRLVVRRGRSTDAAPGPAPEAVSPAVAAETPDRASPGKTAAQASAPIGAGDDTVVKSPMAGTFYSRPSPDDDPFVGEGTQVTAGTPLCLIEVMKLYTTIEASVDGVVESILVEDGALVEFDQPLFVIDRHGA